MPHPPHPPPAAHHPPRPPHPPACPPQFELRRFLEGVYGLEVEKVNTLNVEGRKKRGKKGYYRRPDWKKAYVILKGEGAAAAGGAK